MKKWTKRLLLSGVAAVALHHYMAPMEIEFDAERTYEPNAVQQEFLRLSAQKYSYIALGDTDHRDATVLMFSLSKAALQAFSQGGKKHYFLEDNPDLQDTMDKLHDGTLEVTYNYAETTSMWLCNAGLKRKLNKVANQSFANPDMQFIAADMRHAGDSFMKNLSPYEQFVFEKSIDSYRAVYGCVGPAAFYPASILTAGSIFKNIAAEIKDDTNTAQYMKSTAEEGVILYGAGHFTDEYDGKSLRTLLPDENKTLGVINVYRNVAAAGDLEETKTAPDGRDLKKADAILYVDPSAQNPDGITVINPAMQTIYDQAKQNVAAASKLTI